jgi:VanZ family protein
MSRTLQFVKKYPLSLLCIALVWYLSIWFMPPKELKLPSINFMDKWTHLVMYGGTSLVVWREYLRCHQAESIRPLFLPMVALMLMGGLLELMQAYCTTTRSGEWLDFWADSIGVLLGCGAGYLIYVVKRKRK